MSQKQNNRFSPARPSKYSPKRMQIRFTGEDFKCEECGEELAEKDIDTRYIKEAILCTSCADEVYKAEKERGEKSKNAQAGL